jgi:hypothetical protein
MFEQFAATEWGLNALIHCIMHKVVVQIVMVISPQALHQRSSSANQYANYIKSNMRQNTIQIQTTLFTIIFVTSFHYTKL